MKRHLAVMLAPAIFLAMTTVSHAQVGAATATYAVKFVCGFEQAPDEIQFPSEPPVKPGNYASAVNILNYHRFPITICKEARVAVPESCFDANGKPPPGTNCTQFAGVRKAVVLKPQQAMEVDCSDIATILSTPGAAGLPSFIKGFVEIIVPLRQGAPSTVGLPLLPANPLAVTGVYTAQQCVNAPGAQCGNNLFPGGIDVVPETSQPGEVPAECVNANPTGGGTTNPN